MIRGIFITGTDTGVGKTYVGAMLAKELGRRFVDVGVMKPAETGCRKRNGKIYPGDAAFLRKAAGVRDRIEDVCSYRFSRPLAPSVAAEMEGKRVDPKKIINTFRVLSKKHDFMIVEGAGGIMVPLVDRYTYLDLALDLGLPVAIVARPGLGTINHTLLTVAALQARALRIAGVIINYSVNGKVGLAEKTSPAVIEHLSGISILGTVQHGSDNVNAIAGKILSLAAAGR
jgi:dethiobiotin synthetase